MRNGTELALRFGDPFHGVGAERADQLVLEVRIADVEAEALHVGPREVGAEPGPLETASEVALLGRVAEPCEPDVQPLRAEPPQEPADRLRTADRHDGNALGTEIPASSLGECLHCRLIADSFHEHDRAHVGPDREHSLVHRRIFPAPEGLGLYVVSVRWNSAVPSPPSSRRSWRTRYVPRAPA